MRYAGCDLGSTTGKIVVLVDDGADGADVAIEDYLVEPAGYQPEETARRVFALAMGRIGVTSLEAFDAICATGYGRTAVSFIGHNMSEITCHARGARWLDPRIRTVIDIGGQDVKAIAISPTGKVADFGMNDKCSAGTGKFFEVMARTLDCSVPELAQVALRSTAPTMISSQCSVFAESEVISKINQGVSREDLAGGIHVSIAKRLFVMLQRVGIQREVVLTGGCAKNEALRMALQRMIDVDLEVLPTDPQIAGALGAALFARDRARAEAA